MMAKDFGFVQSGYPQGNSNTGQEEGTKYLMRLKPMNWLFYFGAEIRAGL